MYRQSLSRGFCGSLFDNGAVAAPDLAPATVQVFAFATFACAIGILRGSFLIHFDTPARLFVGIEVSILHYRTSVEDFPRRLVKGGVLLDAEVVAHQIERDVGGVADWRYVARTVPCGFHTEDLAHRRHLPGRRESTHLSNVHAHIVDQALGNERGPLMGTVEELSHRQRRCALLANQPEICDVLGRKHVFEEEEMERL